MLAPAPKGAIDSAQLAASLKRCPDTGPTFSANCEAAPSQSDSAAAHTVNKTGFNCSSRLRKNADSSLSSPRKRGYGRLGMTRIEDFAARLKPRPFKTRAKVEFFSSLREARWLLVFDDCLGFDFYEHSG